MMDIMAIDAMHLRKDDIMQNIYSAKNEIDAVEAIVFKGEFSYLVRLYDNDATEFLPPYVWFDDEAKAKAYADKCASIVEGA